MGCLRRGGLFGCGCRPITNPPRFIETRREQNSALAITNLPRADRISAFDFNNDGRPDLLRTYYPSNVLYLNGGAGAFVDSGLRLPNSDLVCAPGDFDLDGDLDLLLGTSHQCYLNCFTMLLRNVVNYPNTPPTSPTGLSFVVTTNNDAILRWSGSSDSQTTNAQMLTYNLRMGTSPGSLNVMSPQADLTTGFRRLPQAGMAQTNQWKLVNPPKGTYYWSVQAIDTVFAGSLFSAENNFTITNSRPGITPISNQNTLPSQPIGPLPFTVWDDETPASSLCYGSLAII